MAGTFRSQRGGPGYTLDWNGAESIATAVEAARRGIDDVSEAGADMARADHIWENRTGQTEAAVFTRHAVVELAGTTPDATPHVWGEWGVEDRPRIKHEEDENGVMRPVRDENGQLVYEGTLRARGEAEEAQLLTTKDVALFLEFGTVRMHARPWLYPAWDATKVLLPAAIARHYRAIAAGAR